MKKDLIVGCYTNYDWHKIKYWANSIDRSGFTGDKFMLVYNSDFYTVQKLLENKFKIWAFNRDDARQIFFWPNQLIIVVQRFYDLWRFFSNMDLSEYRYVVHTDVKDIVFQTNPSDWLTANMGDAKILASSESLQYQHEPWGNENIANSFPMIYDKMHDQPIWNCGVQAGDPKVMKDLWLQIWLLCQNNRVLNPDQAAYNVLLNLEPYKSMTKFIGSEAGWACQAGTTVDPSKIQGYRPHLLEPEPIWKNDLACTSTGIPHAILHQYDRVPAWNSIIERKFA